MAEIHPPASRWRRALPPSDPALCSGGGGRGSFFAPGGLCSPGPFFFLFGGGGGFCFLSGGGALFFFFFFSLGGGAFFLWGGGFCLGMVAGGAGWFFLGGVGGFPKAIFFSSFPLQPINTRACSRREGLGGTCHLHYNDSPRRRKDRRRPPKLPRRQRSTRPGDFRETARTAGRVTIVSAARFDYAIRVSRQIRRAMEKSAEREFRGYCLFLERAAAARRLHVVFRR